MEVMDLKLVVFIKTLTGGLRVAASLKRQDYIKMCPVITTLLVIREPQGLVLYICN